MEILCWMEYEQGSSDAAKVVELFDDPVEESMDFSLLF